MWHKLRNCIVLVRCNDRNLRIRTRMIVKNDGQKNCIRNLVLKRA